MDNDVFGIVTLDKLKKVVESGMKTTEDVNYCTMFLERYLARELKNLARTGYTDIDGIKTALELFGIKMCSSKNNQLQKQALLDRKGCTLSWYEDINKNGGSAFYRTTYVVSPAGLGRYTELIRQKKQRNRRRFSDLPPELQAKLRNRYPDKFKY